MKVRVSGYGASIVYEWKAPTKPPASGLTKFLHELGLDRCYLNVASAIDRAPGATPSISSPLDNAQWIQQQQRNKPRSLPSTSAD